MADEEFITRFNVFEHYTNEELETIIKFVKAMIKSMQKEWDCVIAIDGTEGVGKSSLAILLGLLFDYYSKVPFYLDKNVAYLPTKQETIDKFMALPEKSVFLLDEAIKSLYKRTWSNSVQTKIIEMYGTERSQYKATILCIPRFNDLDENFRNWRVRYRINVIDRGKAIVYIKDEDKDIIDVWHVKENNKYKEHYFRNKPICARTIDDRLKAERKLKNYFFDFDFPILKPEISEAYKKLRYLFRQRAREQKEDLTISMLEKRYKDKLKLGLYKLTREHGWTVVEASSLFEIAEKRAYLLMLEYKREHGIEGNDDRKSPEKREILNIT